MSSNNKQNSSEVAENKNKEDKQEIVTEVLHKKTQPQAVVPENKGFKNSDTTTNEDQIEFNFTEQKPEKPSPLVEKQQESTKSENPRPVKQINKSNSTVQRETSEDWGAAQSFYLSDSDRNRFLKNFKVFNKDLYLKMLGKALYNRKNYYCELECKIFDDTYYKVYKKEEISDIDVFAIKFEEDLTYIKVGLECKSTIREGVEEILKLKGTQEYMGLNFAGLLKKKVSNNVRTVAKKLNIELYDEDEILNMVQNLVPNSQDIVQRETTLYSLRKSIENEIKPHFKGMISYISSDFWTNEPYQNINTIVRGIEHVRENRELMPYQKRYLLIKLSLLLSLSYLEIISFIVRTNYSQAGQVALDQLFGGAALRREKERTFDLISQEIGKKMHPYPFFTEDYLNIIHWYIAELEAASTVPLCIEEILNCFLLGKDIKNVVSNNFSDYTIKLSKDIIRFSSKIFKDQNILKEIYEI